MTTTNHRPRETDRQSVGTGETPESVGTGEIPESVGTGEIPESVGTEGRYDAAVAALFDRRPEWMVPGLRRIRALSDRLGVPQHAYRCLHITGTNGKTSTARMATSLLLAAGHHVGTYTSPHLRDVRERLLIDGLPVTRQAFLTAYDEVAGAIAATEAELGQMVTFFEALTAVAAVCYREAGVEVGVVEVGMGGRWDATNVHAGAVAIIGTVGLDHPELGATLAEVAREKAGIIERGAVVVVGPQPPEAETVILAEAAARHARLLRYGHEVEVESRQAVPGGQHVVVRVADSRYAFSLPLHGEHQAVNAALALAAVDALLAQEGGLGPEVVRAGLGRAVSPGRLETFARDGHPDVILDAAHNPDGARALVTALQELYPGRRLTMVIGILADKDIDEVLRILLPHADAAIVTPPPHPRAPSTDELVRAAGRAGHDVLAAPTFVDALARADELNGPDDVVLVTGSIYLLGVAGALLTVRAGVPPHDTSPQQPTDQR